MATRPGGQRLPLRHPAEIPMFVFLVVLNAAIFVVLVDVVVLAQLVPYAVRGTRWEMTIRTAAGAILLVAPALVVVRQVQRAAIRGTAVQLSRTQFPDLHASLEDHARKLGLRRTPALFLSNGNGVLNAFAAQSGWSNNYVAVSNELFANLSDRNREGLRFILGHEAAHIQLSHVALWYQLVICYSQLIPILGPTLSRLREYSCDRNGAALVPNGEIGLILLTAGRYAADAVQVDELADQGRHLGGFWVGIAQLPRSHPWTVRRIWRLRQLGLFGRTDTAAQQTGAGRPPSARPGRSRSAGRTN